MKKGFLILESGEEFQGQWRGGTDRAGEVVFNTSHSGYEEMATDPSYFSQILVLTAPMQGNYGADEEVWESRQPWIHGFVCLEMQESPRDRDWLRRLDECGIPVLANVDTRKITLRLRSDGTVWGAVVQAENSAEAQEKAKRLIAEAKKIDGDWTHLVSCKEAKTYEGTGKNGPKVAVIDFGCKENTLRELRARCREVRIFPSRTSAAEIMDWQPDGILLSNGPGDPALVEVATDTVRELLGKKYIFGICMGNQILARALGAKTYKLRFGHRGSNHPVKDMILDRICMTSQNHGYAVDEKSLPANARVSHVHLSDGTVAGIICEELKCMSVQFHPESHPGPRDSESLFNYFIEQLK